MDIDEYAKIAPYYENLLSSFLDPIRKHICTFIHHHNHTKIIDVCCGTGRQLDMLDSEGMELVGIDLSAAMLLEANHSDHISYQQLDATEMDFPAESFDAVLLTFSLHEKSEFDRKIITKKSWDLVRPGGHLIIGDYSQTESSTMGFIFGKILIPLVERAAGSDHFYCYQSWMQNGAIEDFILHLHHKTEIISTHFSGSIMVCSIQKESELNIAFSAVNLP